MMENPGVGHFFQHWARSSLHSLSYCIGAASKNGRRCEERMPEIFFFLDSLSHHYMGTRRTTVLGEAMEYLKRFCTDYPAVTRDRCRKALFIVRYLYKALGLEQGFAHPQDAGGSGTLVERRSVRRYPLFTPVRFRRGAGGTWLPSRLINVSEKGLRLEAERPVEEGEIIQVEFSLPEGWDTLILDARAIWTADGLSGGERECGLRLSGSTQPAARERLVSLVREMALRVPLY